MISVTVMLTCFNRKAATRNCIESIYDSEFRIQYIVADDGSTDGTQEMLSELKENYDITVLKGNGNLYWCGGMRKAMAYAMQECGRTDYYVLVNDDVYFRDNALRKTVCQSHQRKDNVIVGSVCNHQGELVYGGIKFFPNSIKYHTVSFEDNPECDTFNCNFVLIPARIFLEAGNLDDCYSHSMADFDYGLQMRRKGYSIYRSDEFVGECEKNDVSGTWQDKSLSPIERIRKKRMPKGLPEKEWFHYLNKNFGLRKAIWHSITPFLRIIMGR